MTKIKTFINNMVIFKKNIAHFMIYKRKMCCFLHKTEFDPCPFKSLKEPSKNEHTDLCILFKLLILFCMLS